MGGRSESLDIFVVFSCWRFLGFCEVSLLEIR